MSSRTHSHMHCGSTYDPFFHFHTYFSSQKSFFSSHICLSLMELRDEDLHMRYGKFQCHRALEPPAQSNPITLSSAIHRSIVFPSFSFSLLGFTLFFHFFSPFFLVEKIFLESIIRFSHLLTV